MDLNRREILTLGTGYALAVMPVTAWALNTPAPDVETTVVQIPSGKDKLPAFLAVPKKPGKYPCVLLVHEIFGIHEYIRDVCRRLANAGYIVLSPSLYFRQGDATKITDIPTLQEKIVKKVPQAQVLEDLDACVKWLGTNKKAEPGKIGITGFCWGGGATWLYSAHNPQLKAGVAWYGRLTGEASPLQPKFPLDIAASLTVPVLGLYGAKDKGIPLADVEKMRAELAKGKSQSKIIVYDEAEHGFHADYRPSYHAKSAQDAWQQMLDWFKAKDLAPKV